MTARYGTLGAMVDRDSAPSASGRIPASPRRLAFPIALGLIVLVIGGPLLLRARMLRQGSKQLRREIRASEREGLRIQRPARPPLDAGSRALLAAIESALLVDPAAPTEQALAARVALHALTLRGDELAEAPAELTQLVAERREVLARAQAMLLDAGASWRWPSEPPRWAEQAAVVAPGPTTGSVPDSPLAAHARALLGYRELGQLLIVDALQRGDATPLLAALRLRRAIAPAATPLAAHACYRLTAAALEGLAALLRRRVEVPLPLSQQLELELTYDDALPAAVHRARLADLADDGKQLLEDGEGRLAQDYLSEGGTATGLWVRRGLCGPTLARGLRLGRLAVACASLPDPAERLARTRELEGAWRRWVDELGSRHLYRTTPLPLELARQVDARLRAGARGALLRERGEAIPDGLLADGDGVALPPTAALPPHRLRWPGGD